MPADVLESLTKLWRRQQYEFLTASRIICKTPGFLVYAHLGNTSSTARYAKLYDGESANEAQIGELCAPVKGNDALAPSLPIPFQRGLYATVESDNCPLTVVIITVKE